MSQGNSLTIYRGVCTVTEYTEMVSWMDNHIKSGSVISMVTNAVNTELFVGVLFTARVR